MSPVEDNANTLTGPGLIPAATVVLICDTADGLQTLMLKRNAALNFAGGNWVFPGGRVDPADRPADNVAVDTSDIDLRAAINAAVRETAEEAGLSIACEHLVYLSHWVAPPLLKKRFTTWFFVAEVDCAAQKSIAIDGGEIHEYRWLSPRDVLANSRDGSMSILPPTLVTLTEMQRFDTATQLLQHHRHRDPFIYQPRIYAGEDDGRVVFFYQGDAGYEARAPDAPGERHRVSFVDGVPVYENTLR